MTYECIWKTMFIYWNLFIWSIGNSYSRRLTDSTRWHVNYLFLMLVERYSTFWLDRGKWCTLHFSEARILSFENNFTYSQQWYTIDVFGRKTNHVILSLYYLFIFSYACSLKVYFVFIRNAFSALRYTVSWAWGWWGDSISGQEPYIWLSMQVIGG